MKFYRSYRCIVFIVKYIQTLQNNTFFYCGRIRSLHTIGRMEEKATFAGGCFWCVEHDFDHVKGVLSTTSGYMGGNTPDPSYEQVCTGNTGHAEVLQVTFDPKVVSYEELLEIFWKHHDPTVQNRQFCDTGNQYRPEIFYHSNKQRKLAEKSLEEVIQSGRFEEVYTRISEAGTFYPAEEYHQKYYKKNPIRYQGYRMGSGRDQRLKDLWE